MSESQHAADLDEVLIGLHFIARTLLLQVCHENNTYRRQAASLAHISWALALASETSSYHEERFLTELIALCRWHWGLFDRVWNIVSSSTTWLCQEDVKHARMGFMAYANAEPKEQEKLHYFRANKPYRLTMDLSIDVYADALRTNVVGDTKEDLPSDATKDFYTALSKYSNCDDPYPQEDRPNTLHHEVRLCLSSDSQKLGQGHTFFDVHTRCSPALLSDGSSYHWQQLRFRIAVEQPKPKSVAWAIPTSPSCNLPNPDYAHQKTPVTNNTKTLSRKDYCNLLRSNKGPIKRCLRIMDQSLCDSGDEATHQNLLSTESIPLAEVLNSYDLSRKQKLILGYTLARSLWQYYDSNWTNDSWSASSIHFMWEKDSSPLERPMITSEPCFAVKFHDGDDGLPECYNLGHVSHRFPRIFSLGTLLFEIGQDTHNQNEQHITLPLEQRINDTHLSMRNQTNSKSWPVFGHNDRAGDNLRMYYRGATRACLDYDLFKPICDRCRRKHTACSGLITESCIDCSDAGEDCKYKGHPRGDRDAYVSGAQSRKEILLNHVVKPLRMALNSIGWNPVAKEPRFIPPKRVNDDTPGISDRLRGSLKYNLKRRGDVLPPPRKRIRPSSVRFYDDHQMDDETLASKSERYEEWKNSAFLDVGKKFKFTKEPPVEGKRLKIAVLDTGLDKTHPDIMNDLGRIWIYDSSRNIFSPIDDNTSIKDHIGHGTHVAGLILEYALHTDLYVADVTVEDEPDQALIAKTILSAVDYGVNIISISFGFPVKDSAIEDAIKHAANEGVHTVAAASNCGGNDGRSYPAKHSNVFCIHSTDANGNPSGFNPTEVEGPNFATIGEAVVSSWPLALSQSSQSYGEKNEDCDEPETAAKSGTSFATPIAACMIAFLLRYVDEDEHLKKDRGELKKYAVMESLLKCMAGEKRLGFSYLTLSHLFREEPEYIRATIKMAIKKSP